MGFLSKIFGNNNQPNNQSSHNTALSVRNTVLQPNQPMLTVHPDIREFLWIGDGRYKNYVPTPSNNKISISVQGITITVAFGIDEEPSLIYMGLPIGDGSGTVERPPYYPTYKGLTPSQKGIYWKLLANPYDNTIDIGYVFILYYGLERYLLSDKYEKVIDIILKLRDVHQNKSFQSYTANAVILTCLHRQRADIVQKFMNSLDKEYEFGFSSNLFLLCKYSLGIPLTSIEIMRMAKAFEFTKNNYIKKYPDLFLAALSHNIDVIYKSGNISWDKLLTSSGFNKLPKEDIPIFANVSIRDKSIKVPSMLTSFKLKKKIYDILDKSHEDVKRQLAEMKKNGENVPEAKATSVSEKKTEVAHSFDTAQEQLLLKTFNSVRNNSLDQHFASISLQVFYYKYRNLGQEYVEKCIEYCKDDISRLPEIQRTYIEDEKKEILSRQWLTSEEKQKQISEIRPFFANIPAFKRLAIIYEKEKDYDSAIRICDHAISFYSSGNLQSQVLEFEERKQKLLNKRKR